MDRLVLPAELERFEAGAVANGNSRDPADVIAAGVRLLRDQQTARAAFVHSLDGAFEEAERDGWASLENVMTEADATVAEMCKAG